MGPAQNEELRVRATNLQLERLSALLPTFSFLSPDVLDRWNDLQPQGTMEALALDIPLNQPEKSRFGRCGAMSAGSVGNCCRASTTSPGR